MSARFVRSLFAIAVAVLVAGVTPAHAQAKPSPGAGPILVMQTLKGTIEIETYPNEAPKSVEHIVALVNRRFYNGQRIHRVEPGFVVQFGDPTTRDMTKQADWGRYGSGKSIGVGEMSKMRTHVRGAVALAHRGDPGEADSQLYICLRAAPELDGDFTVVGKVISGMDVADKLEVTDRIVRITVREAK